MVRRRMRSAMRRRTNATISPNLRREMRKRVAQSNHWGLYTAVSHNTLVGTEEPLNTFYIDSGASDHLVP